eukprot:CAMPEP_0119484564 /NCGR_PEP_ID=MMETSP1344-20130328/11533_1 /TAXON_ID=236787 /ORGANISM="Florenciella parvula, Strain CCMP2471" /LENGTH=97 /DNA_ID=CAMNT_0007519159 /DNA_START=144 /DNA_END=435 /DNA_ORIENTATION=+
MARGPGVSDGALGSGVHRRVCGAAHGWDGHAFQCAATANQPSIQQWGERIAEQGRPPKREQRRHEGEASLSIELRATQNRVEEIFSPYSATGSQADA